MSPLATSFSCGAQGLILPGARLDGQYPIVLGDGVLLPIGDCSQYPLLNLEVFVLQKVDVSAPLLASILYKLLCGGGGCV